MSAVDAIRAGQLQEALALVQNAVRQHPAEARHRVFLFQILAVLGQWDRAMTQLKVAAELDAANLHMLHAYREALQCEALRTAIFAGRHQPVIFGDPEPWIAQMTEALRLGAEGRHEQASQLRMQAFEAAPTSSGTINGERFEWIADADPRLGPILEVLVNGRYFWVPFSRIKSMIVEAPADLRDSVWMPVHLTWSNGGTTVGFIPTRYPGTTESGDSDLILARKTIWHEIAGDVFFGAGQRVFATDTGDVSLMDVRKLEFDIDVSEPDAPQAGSAMADEEGK